MTRKRLLIAYALATAMQLLLLLLLQQVGTELRQGTPETAATRAADFEEEINVLHSMCADSYGRDGKGDQFYGFTVIKSILLTRARGANPNRRMIFHVFIDRDMESLLGRPTLHETHPALADVLLYIRNYTRGRVRLTFHPVEEAEAEAAAAIGMTAGEIGPSLFRRCASMRLKAPYLAALMNVSKIIYIDWDSIVLCDISQLWDFAWPQGAMFAAADEAPFVGAPSLYRHLPKAFDSGLNSGVLFMRLDRLRDPAVLGLYWALISRIARDNGYRKHVPVGAGTEHSRDGLAYGDQDILNLLASEHPKWFSRLDLKWNWWVFNWR